MLTNVLWIIAAACVFAVLYWLMTEGVRNGDRPADAQVSAVLATPAQPDEARPVIVVTVRNPAGAPVLVALRARRALLPATLGEPHEVSVARLTGRRKFRPGGYATVGVAPAGGVAELAVPVAARAGAFVLTAAVGQEGGRLRVHRLRLGSAGHQPKGRDELFTPFTLR